MARKVIHRKASSSWWNGTVTAMCGHVTPKKYAESVWFGSVNCPGCRAAIRSRSGGK